MPKCRNENSFPNKRSRKEKNGEKDSNTRDGSCTSRVSSISDMSVGSVPESMKNANNTTGNIQNEHSTPVNEDERPGIDINKIQVTEVRNVKNDVSKPELSETSNGVLTVLNNAIYSENARKLSAMCNVNLKNRFMPLMDNSTEFIHIIENNKKAKTPKPVNENKVEDVSASKKIRPPPIHLIGLIETEFNLLLKTIKEITREFHVVQKRQMKETIIQFHCLSHHKFFIEKYQNVLPFYTYTTKSEKTFTYVVKGLTDDAEAESIVCEINDVGVECKRVIKMKGTKYPMFMVVLSRHAALEELNKRVRFLNYTRVYWEAFTNSKQVVQCKLCQQWQHVTQNCYLRIVKCVKCAGDHHSYQCQKKFEDPCKCANCGGDHPASSVDCPVYISIIEGRAKISEKKNLEILKSQVSNSNRRTFAPAPTVNPWGNNTQKAEKSQNFPPLRTPINSGPPPPQPRPSPPQQQRQPQASSTPSSSNSVPEMKEIFEVFASVKEIFSLIDMKWLRAILSRIKNSLREGKHIIQILIEELANNDQY